MKKEIIIVGLIVVVGLLLRLIWLDQRPIGFTWDEAALGYNAYSILKTGRDEHQQILPIVFKSFGDYKPGLYVYLTVPAVAILGLTETAARLPSAVIGGLIPIVVWLLTKRLFPRLANSWTVALVVALNPWSIYFSRGAWEANVMVFMSVLAIVLALKKRLVWASVLWGLTFWTYQGAKMITPLLILGWGLVWGRKLGKVQKLIAPVIVLSLFLAPLVINLKTQSGRLEVFSVFSYTRPQEVIDRVMSQDNAQVGSGIYYLFHSEILDQARGIVQRYLNHYSPRFLFLEGDWTSMRHSIAYYGYLHLPEVVLLIIGLVWLVRNWSDSSKLIIYWLAVAAIPSALSRDLVSGVRALPMVIPLTMIVGIGLAQLLNKKILAWLYICVWTFFLGLFMDLYFKHSPNYRSDEWVSFYQSAIAKVNENSPDYKQIVFTSKYGQPYIFVLFYNRVDPRLFWQTVKRTGNIGPDVGEVVAFDKWRFERFYWPQTRAEKSTLVVGDEFELPAQDLEQDNLVRIAEINYPNGAMAIREVGLK